jgi:beta-lactamase regulating signal transducer with metallopeptidase domain
MFGQTFLLWALNYVLHSTLLFLLSRIILTLPAISARNKELILRYALFCAIPTSIFQTVFGVGFNLTVFNHNGLTEAVKGPAIDPGTGTAPFIFLTELWTGIVVTIWCVGLVFLLIRYIFARNKFLLGIRPLTPVATTQILVTLDDVQRALPRPLNISVATSEKLKSPITVDGKYIYLPVQCLNELNSFQLKCLFAHEVAHIARRDDLWMIIYKIVGSVLFFQPLNRIIINDLHNVSEKLCDSWAVEVTGNRFELARCLVTVASWYSSPTYSRHLPGAVTKKSQLKQRIEHLMAGREENKPLYTRSLFMTFAIVMLVMIFLAPGFSLNPSDIQQQKPVTKIPQTGKEDRRGPAETKMTGEHEVNVDVRQNVEPAKVDTKTDVNLSVSQEVELDIKPVKPATSNKSTRPKNAGHNRGIHK